MSKILVVDDDPVVRAIYCDKFVAAGCSTEVAQDGEEALQRAETFHPDLILLDLMIPKFSGIEVITALRAHEEWRHTPIVVLSNSYAGEILKEAWSAGATQCLSKMSITPNHIFDISMSLLAQSVTKAAGKSGQTSGDKEQRHEDNMDVFHVELRRTFVNRIPHFSAEIEKSMELLIGHSESAVLSSSLPAVLITIHRMAGHAALAGFEKIAHLAGAIGMLGKDLMAKRTVLTPENIRTISDGVACLNDLLSETTVNSYDKCNAPLILAVDDDPVSLEVLSGALELADLKAIRVDRADIAMRLLTQNHFDLVFLDVNLVGVKGFDLCRLARRMKGNEDLPIVFVTSLSDQESRAKADSCGGNDFIVKPFLPMELAVKALTYLLKPRNAEAMRLSA